MLYDNDFLRAGLWRVSDLYNNAGMSIPFTVWKNRVCKSKFLTWRKLISKTRSSNLSFDNIQTDIEHSMVVALGDELILDVQNENRPLKQNIRSFSLY